MRGRFPEPCMCGAPDCPICGPLQGYGSIFDEDEYDVRAREQYEDQRRLVQDLNMMIRHIADHNSFDKQDLILLLKRARDWVDNTPIL